MGFQIMLDQANCFYICAKMCENKIEKFKGRLDIFATPMITNLSLACEIYIKTLLDYQKKSIKKNHKLNELFELLSVDEQEQIRTAVENNYGIIMDSNDKPLIDTVADTFAKWRYSYESSHVDCDISYLFALTEAVRNVCCARIYKLSWKEYCKTAKITSDLWE